LELQKTVGASEDTRLHLLKAEEIQMLKNEEYKKMSWSEWFGQGMFKPPSKNETDLQESWKNLINQTKEYNVVLRDDTFVQQKAQALGLSSATPTMHIEDAGLHVCRCSKNHIFPNPLFTHSNVGFYICENPVHASGDWVVLPDTDHIKTTYPNAYYQHHDQDYVMLNKLPPSLLPYINHLQVSSQQLRPRMY